MILLPKIIENIILLEYNEVTIRKIIDKFKKELGNNLDEAAVRYYITRFSQLKESPRFGQYVTANFPEIQNYRDILLYKFQQVEAAVDQFRPRERTSAPTTQVTQTSAAPAIVKDSDLEIIHNADNLEVYLAHNEQGCIKVNSGLIGAPRNDYTFCISRKTGSLYNSYRNRGKTFYFVLDKDRPVSDPIHLLVVHANNNGSFGLSLATNIGDQDPVQWSDIVRRQPKLAELQQLFQFKAYSEAELDQQMASNTLTVAQFNELPPPRQIRYCQGGGQVEYESFRLLPREIKDVYINNTRKIFNGYQIPDQLLRLREESLPHFKRLKVRAHRGELTQQWDIEQTKHLFIEPEEVPVIREQIVSGKYTRPLTAEVLKMVVDINDPVSTVKMYAQIGNSALRGNTLESAMNGTPKLKEQYQDEIFKNLVTNQRKIAININAPYPLLDAGFNLLNEVQKKYLFDETPIGWSILTQSRWYRDSVETQVQTFLNNLPPTSIDKILKDIGEQDTTSLLEKVMNMFVRYSHIPSASYTALYWGIVVPMTSLNNGIVVGDRWYVDSTTQFFGLKNMSYMIRFEKSKNYIKVDQIHRKVAQYQLPKDLPSATKKYGVNFDEVTLQFKKPEIDIIPLENPYRKFLEIRKHNDAYNETLKYCRRYTLKIGKATPLKDSPAFVFPYAGLNNGLSGKTAQNLYNLNRLFKIVWETVYISPVIGRNAWSYYIVGKFANGAPCVYARKESSSFGAGTTKLYSPEGNDQVSNILAGRL